MMDDVLNQTKEKMEKAVKNFEDELKTIRTGKASVHMLDGIMVNYYGSPTPINQVATISTPDPTLIVIQPWDATVIPEIEKAILSSDIGITPSNDGKVVRLPVPPLTEERRKQLVKNVNQMTEEKRIAIRHIRHEAREKIQKMQKNKEISEDDEKRGLDKVQKLTDEYIKKVDEMAKEKEKELMKV